MPAYSPLSAGALVAALGGRALQASVELQKARSLLAAEFTADNVILVDSGRSALRLAITQALSTARARPVVALPAFQCYEVATAAVGADCRIVLYDIDPASLTPDMGSLERALKLGAGAAVIAPLYGLPVDWESIVELTSRYGALAIEDAAQAHGAQWKGRALGSLGQMSVVSFGRGKGWTGGGGGALLLRGASAQTLPDHDAQLPDAGGSAELRIVAVAMLQLAFGRPALYGIPASIPSLGLGETRYHAPTAVRRATRFSAALLRRTLDAASAEIACRRRNAAHWLDALPNELRAGAAPVNEHGEPGYLRFPLRISSEAARLASEDAARRAGIARSYPRPLGELPAVAERLVEPGSRFPGAESLSRELVTLPTHSRLTRRQQDEIVSRVRAWTPRASHSL